MTIFQKLCVKIVQDPSFAQEVLHGNAQQQRVALDAFLDGENFVGDRDQAIHDLIAAIKMADLGAIKDLQKTLDSVTPQIAI